VARSAALVPENSRSNLRELSGRMSNAFVKPQTDPLATSNAQRPRRFESPTTELRSGLDNEAPVVMNEG